MEKISVMIPCFNEVENVEPISEAVKSFHSMIMKFYLLIMHRRMEPEISSRKYVHLIIK